MTTKNCPHPVRVPREIVEVESGNEILTVQKYYCHTCGAFTHWAVLSRRPK